MSRIVRSRNGQRVSKTEAMILNEGFGPPWSERVLSLAELADRLEVSVGALAPHLRVLIERGDLVELPLTGKYRRAG